ncbi:MAG: type II toxin-antitoxin system RelE/ParE family toxin [Planctomycetia bacterium]
MSRPWKVILAPAAEADLAEILAWSAEAFGNAARRRYAALIVQAIEDLTVDPARVGVETRPEIAAGVQTYHLAHSRNRVAPAAGRVITPRHFVIFRLRSDSALEIARVLHDSMDLARHLPPAE